MRNKRPILTSGSIHSGYKTGNKYNQWDDCQYLKITLFIQSVGIVAILICILTISTTATVLEPRCREMQQHGLMITIFHPEKDPFKKLSRISTDSDVQVADWRITPSMAKSKLLQNGILPCSPNLLSQHRSRIMGHLS